MALVNFGNIAGIVKHHLEPVEGDGTTPKRYVIWAKETTAGSAEVTLMRYDFVNSKWVPFSSTAQVFNADIGVKLQVNLLVSHTALQGSSITPGMRVLLFGQSDQSENGLYDVSPSSMLVRPSKFSGTVEGDHIVYIRRGNYAGGAFLTINDSHVNGFVVDTDPIKYRSPDIGVVDTGTLLTLLPFGIRTRQTNIVTTSNDGPLTAGQVAAFNALPQFTSTLDEIITIKHQWTESGADRYAFLQVNRPSGQTVFGAGATALTAANFTLISNNNPQLFHPDEVGLNGMGDWDFGFPDQNIADNTGKTQQDWNKAVEEIFKDIYVTGANRVTQTDLGTITSPTTVHDTINRLPQFQFNVTEDLYFKINRDGQDEYYKIGSGWGKYGVLSGNTLTAADLIQVPNPNFVLPHATNETFTATAGQTTFTVANTILVTEHIFVYRNGNLQDEGAGNDFTRTTTQVIFNYGLNLDDKVKIFYKYS